MGIEETATAEFGRIGESVGVVVGCRHSESAAAEGADNGQASAAVGIGDENSTGVLVLHGF